MKDTSLRRLQELTAARANAKRAAEPVAKVSIVVIDDDETILNALNSVLCGKTSTQSFGS